MIRKIFNKDKLKARCKALWLKTRSGFKKAKVALKKGGKKVINYPGFGLIITIIVLLSLLGGFDGEGFYSWDKFSLLLSSNAPYTLLAVGIMCVLLTGGIDISVGSTLALSACITSKLAVNNPGVPVFFWVVLAIIVGAFCGLINGCLVGKLKIAPMIATLGTMFAYRGLSYIVTNGKWYVGDDFNKVPSFSLIGKCEILGLYSSTWIAILVLILITIFLALTRPGRRLYAIGTNEESAKLSGINTANVKILAYTICGALAGLAGIIFASVEREVYSEIGINYEMTAIAICVIGGVANTGGKGRVDTLILGILFMIFLSRLLAVWSQMAMFEELIKGLIILIAVTINIANDLIRKRREVLEMGRRL